MKLIMQIVGNCVTVDICTPHCCYGPSPTTLVIAWACVSQYMHVSGQPLQAKDDELYELAQAVRAQEADLRTIGQRLESWRSK